MKIALPQSIVIENHDWGWLNRLKNRGERRENEGSGWKKGRWFSSPGQSSQACPTLATKMGRQEALSSWLKSQAISCVWLFIDVSVVFLCFDQYKEKSR